MSGIPRRRLKDLRKIEKRCITLLREVQRVDGLPPEERESERPRLLRRIDRVEVEVRELGEMSPGLTSALNKIRKQLQQ